MTTFAALPRWLLAFLGTAAALLGQDGGKKDDDEVSRTPVDPYTGGDLTVLAAAGLAGYGPFVWADGHRTEDLERVLGQGRVLWLETEHFRIGSNLRTINAPVEGGPKKALHDECKALKQRLPKVPDRPKRLDPWLRLHLHAQRAERIYAEFEQMLGAHVDKNASGKEPPNGRYLGLPDKYLLLLFEKKSDLARYLDRFCGAQGERSYGHYHDKTHQMVFALSAEGLEITEDAGLHSHFVYGLVGNLVQGYRGFTYQVPPWLAEGLAHWFSRRIDTKYINVTVADDDGVAAVAQHEWHKKVRTRVQSERTLIPFTTALDWPDGRAMGYHGHLQSWSRVDYLRSLSPAKVGDLLHRLKGLPHGATVAQLREATLPALEEVFGLQPGTFDARWRDWVLKTYPKK